MGAQSEDQLIQCLLAWEEGAREDWRRIKAGAEGLGFGLLQRIRLNMGATVLLLGAVFLAPFLASASPIECEYFKVFTFIAD